SGRVPAVRVRPVPRSEPPTDDELRAAGLQAPPMAAPALPLRMPTQRRRPSPRRARPVAAPAAAEAEPPAGPPVASPARLATRRFLAVCIEVLGGFRPVTQLRALCLPGRFEEITQRLRVHTPGALPGSRPPGTAPRPPDRLPVVSPVPRRAPTGAPPRP